MGTTPFPLIFIIYAASSVEGFSCAGASFVPALARPVMTAGVGLLYGVK